MAPNNKKVDVDALLAKAKKPAADAMELHPFYRGKVETTLKCTVRDFNDFAPHPNHYTTLWNGPIFAGQAEQSVSYLLGLSAVPKPRRSGVGTRVGVGVGVGIGVSVRSKSW